jgi:hypothetical protein
MAMKEIAKAETAAREPKPIKPADVTIQASGFVFKSVVVNMQDDITLDDVGNKPGIWKNVQTDRTGKALTEDDKVEMRWLDKRVFAVVDYADSAGVVFCDIRKATKRDRDREPWKDGTYAIRWTTGGWAYFRIHDGVRPSNSSWPTWEAAKLACIREQYPARAA